MKTLWNHIDDDFHGTTGAPAWRGFAAGLALVLAEATIMLVWRPDVLHAGSLFGLPAIIAAAALGGLWPGLFTTVLVAGGQWYLDLVQHADDEGLIGHLALTLVYGATISAGAEALRRQRQTSNATAKRLRIREAHLQLILDTVPDAMLVCDEHGIVQSFSSAAERMFGWQADDILGECASRLMAGDGDEAGLGRFIPDGQKPPGAATGLRRDGSTFPLEVTVATFDTAGRQFFTVFARDRSALDDAERKETELRTELTLAWRRNSVGEMASLLAHEINQPLAAITNYLGAARRIAAQQLVEPGRVTEAIDRASAQAMRASEIIRRLRTLIGRSDDGQKAEDLKSVILEIDVFTRPVAREAQVRVEYDFPEEPMLAIADRIQVQQVILNLVRNAVDAMMTSPQRSLRIAVHPDGDHIRVVVEDSGHGIDPAQEAQLFLPTRSSKPNGMGVGLSICRTIVEAHRGRIWAEKNPMGGASICFTLQKIAGENLDVDAA